MSKSVTESNMSAVSRQNYVQQMYGENSQRVPPNQREDVFFSHPKTIILNGFVFGK